MKGVSLKDTAEITSGLVINRFIKQKKSSFLNKPSKYYHVTTKSVQDNKINLELLEEFESSKMIDERYLLKKGDVLMKLTPPYSAAMVDFVQKNIVFPQNFAVIRTHKNFDSEYLSHILNSKNVQNQLQRVVEGGALPIIKISSLNEIKIRFITLDLQQKYAKLLSLLLKRKELKKRTIELEELLTEDILSKL
jgi:restriction endonuclease S subunit